MELTGIRKNGAFALIVIAWLCVAVIGGISFYEHRGWPPIAMAVAATLIPTYLVYSGRIDTTTRMLIGGTMPVYPAIMLFQAAGSSLQMDVHMLFFALLAALVVMCDWRAIVTGTAVIAIHHLGTNFAMPAWVFPDGADLPRVILHAVIVLIEAAVLIQVSLQLERMIERQAEARREAERLEQDAAITREAIAAKQTLVIGALGEGLKAMARNDLTARIDQPFPPEYEQLRADYHGALEGMRNSLDKISGVATRIDESAGDVSHASNDMADRTERQSATLHDTVSTIRSVSDSISETANRAVEARHVLDAAQGEAEKSSGIVESAREAMTNIESSAREIDQIIAVIDALSFQTNLLALNAGVEAARVGEAGKGFAVVASEVRALAQRSAEAAQDIKTKIGTSNEQISLGVSVVSETSETLERITARILQISEFVATIAASVESQAAKLREVNGTVGALDGITQQNAAMVEETSAAARSLAEQSRTLAQEISRFRLGQAGSAKSTPTFARAA
jgi:methyl-accepting chemotaxis protein